MYRQSSLQCQLRTYACDALEMTAVWLLLVTRYRRWSRGHKARGQGHTKNPRPMPRTSLSEDRPLEAREKDARGQGPRTQLEGQDLPKSFLGDLQFRNVPRIFDWWRPKSQITCNDIIKNFPNRKFLWDKDIVGWKI